MGTLTFKMGFKSDIKKRTCSEMPFEKYCLVLGHSKSCKVKLWVKRMGTSTCKMGLGRTLRKELVLKCLLKSIAWCWSIQKSCKVKLWVKRMGKEKRVKMGFL